MIGITIDTHTTRAIANEAGAGGSTGPPRGLSSQGLSSVVVVPDEATPLFFNVPGLTRGESAMLNLWARVGQGGGPEVGWRGAEVRRRLGLVAHVGRRVRGATFCQAPAAKRTGACP